jgi:3-hydroxybutyryl-CoA dehydrogenase
MVDAIRCLENGIGTAADIDTAMMNGANHPMGPLALADFIGLDIVFHMSSLLQEEYKESRFAPPPILRRMVLAGLLGRKTGKGFYDYSANPPTANVALLRR